MKKTILSVFLLFMVCTPSAAQLSQEKRDSIYRLNAADHKLMMEKLGIDSLRPGPSGNPNDPNAANSDESRATTYGALFDPLMFNNGSKVTTKEQWQTRRKEIMEDFDREVYGRLPENIPAVNWKVVSASPVYALLGEKGLETTTYPEVGDFLSNGKLAFRIHEGGHTIEPNWPYFIA